MSVEIVAQNLCKGLGEAPHWEETTSKVLLVDVTERLLLKFNPDTGETETRLTAKEPSFMIPSRAGGYMTSQGKEFCHYDYDNDVMTVLHEVEPGENTAVNDGKCDASGRLWAGTLASGIPSGQCHVYSLETDGSLRERLENINISNGLAWTADNTVMYHVDTTIREIYAYDFNLETGDPTNRRVVKTYAEGFPDGMCIDTEGKLWVAVFGSGTLQRIDPVTGDTLATVQLPEATRPTSCCFGGAGLTDLYVTSATGGLDGNANGGSLFKVTGLPAPGQPVNIYG